MVDVSYSVSPDGTQKVGVKIDLKEAAKNLREFVNFLRDITSIKLNDKNKEAINYAIKDVYASYKLIVDTVKPFKDIENDKFFKVKFKKMYKKFMKINYNIYESEIRSCYSIETMLEQLSNDKSWKTKLPGAQKKLDKLKKLYNKWHVNDNAVYDVMKTFYKDFETKLDEIYENLNNRKVSESHSELNTFLMSYIPKIEDIPPEMKEIEKIRVNL